MTFVKSVCYAASLAGAVMLMLAPAGCNSPYPEEEEGEKALYVSFGSEPQHMDPARSYSAGTSVQLGLTLEQPFQYHYLKRPYRLDPMLVREVPQPKTGELEFDEKIVETRVYTFRVKKGIRYQDHPCFVEANRRLTDEDVRDVTSVADIQDTATRELVADDFVHAIRRLADSRLACPIFPTLAKALLGMTEYQKHLDAQLDKARQEREEAAGALYVREQDEKYNPIQLDYSDGAEAFPFVRPVAGDRYRFELVLKKPYPLILYWMTMTFFSPVPPEAIAFYSQPALLKRNIEFDKNPVGTGPYKLHEFDPTNQIVYVRNENFRPERYPSRPTLAEDDPLQQELHQMRRAAIFFEYKFPRFDPAEEIVYVPKGEALLEPYRSLPSPPRSTPEQKAIYEAMAEAGLFAAAGEPLPMIDRVVFRMDKEAIPRWNKFLQGYYDSSGVDNDMFDQTVMLTSRGESELTDQMAERGIRLLTSYSIVSYFFAFNMTDPVVGGYSEERCKLRRAISIAFDSEEQITVFANGRGVPAHSPIPPGVYGYDTGPEGINPFVYAWDAKRKRGVRRSLKEARELLAEAGYPEGYSADDGQPLTLRYVTGDGSANARSRIKFLKKQLAKLNIQLQVEATDGPRAQEKLRSGNWQFTRGGWLADYPDPENFLLLLYGPNSVMKDGGPNATNYENEEYDELFEKMEGLGDTPERLAVIRKMVRIVQRDAPWVFEYHPESYGLFHRWLDNVYPHPIASNRYKYLRIDVPGREAYRREHNRPRSWPVAILGAVLVIFTIPAVFIARRQFREA